MLKFNLTGNTKLNDGIKIAFIIGSNRSDRKMRLAKLLRTVPQSEKSTVRSQKFALRRSRKLTPANILKNEFEIAVVNNPAVFETRKFYCISIVIKNVALKSYQC